nr:tripartite tricarboxylate transporter TctB family protein [uncultured Sphaerochaeta sp.]
MSTERRKRLPFEAVLALFMMLLVAAIVIDGFFIHELPMKALKYPIFCFSVFFATCVIEIIRSVRKQKTLGEKVEAKPIHHNLRNFSITVGLIVAYVIVMWLFGFIVSSIAITVGFTAIYRVQKNTIVNVVAAVVIITVYFVFSNVLYIFLPEGLLFKMIF